MAESLQTFRTLEQLFADQLASVIEFGTLDVDLEVLDLDSRLVKSPSDVSVYTYLSAVLANIAGETKLQARQTVYRSFVFSFAMAEMCGDYDFSIDFGTYFGMLSELDDPYTTLTKDVQNYLHEKPALNGFIGSFTDELDTSGNGTYEVVSKTICGMTFMLIEQAMQDSYLVAQGQALEANYGGQFTAGN